MAGILDSYGYDGNNTRLVTIKSQEEWRQNEKDKEQDEKIKRNYDDNVYQQDEIDRNSLVNDVQETQINELNEKISQISGGTITDFDMGDW